MRKIQATFLITGLSIAGLFGSLLAEAQTKQPAGAASSAAALRGS